MEGSKVRGETLLVCVLFGAMVLAVFWRSYDKGPISTVRRFHEAVRSQDVMTLQKVVDADTDARGLNVLVTQTRLLLERNATFEVAGMDTSANQVRAAVIYHLPHEAPVVTVWVLDKQRSIWRVNPFKTVSLMEQLVDRSSTAR